nr:hypothetical protein DLTAUQXX_DLTAUQXX_CDS_0048 [uncultured phage]CAI9750144.1 hypothetical protein LUIDIZRK_LUIDIZRK_CDS_0048 [uncultured phage]
MAVLQVQTLSVTFSLFRGNAGALPHLTLSLFII